jgi:hypothetical protein
MTARELLQGELNGSRDIKHYVPDDRALLDPIMGARRFAQRQSQTN